MTNNIIDIYSLDFWINLTKNNKKIYYNLIIYKMNFFHKVIYGRQEYSPKVKTLLNQFGRVPIKHIIIWLQLICALHMYLTHRLLFLNVSYHFKIIKC